MYLINFIYSRFLRFMLRSLTVLEGSLPLHHFHLSLSGLLSSQTPLLTLTLMRPLLTSWVFITFQEAPTHSTVQLPPIHLQALPFNVGLVVQVALLWEDVYQLPMAAVNQPLPTALFWVAVASSSRQALC